MTRPNAFGDNLSCWMASVDIDTTTAWNNFWTIALRSPEVHLVCVCIDDSIELSDETLSVETFPWNERRLIFAAVRMNDGEWETRENPWPSW
ncbi:MAG TPA: hypothetical protein VGD94_20385 [Vicinamibacterales bacterium]